MPTESVNVGKMFTAVCLSVSPERNSKTNYLNVFKLRIGNDLEIS